MPQNSNRSCLDKISYFVSLVCFCFWQDIMHASNTTREVDTDFASWYYCRRLCYKQVFEILQEQYVSGDSTEKEEE